MANAQRMIAGSACLTISPESYVGTIRFGSLLSNRTKYVLQVGAGCQQFFFGSEQQAEKTRSCSLAQDNYATNAAGLGAH